MNHRRMSLVALLSGAVLVTIPAGVQSANASTTYGPSVPYTQELNSPDPVLPLKNQAIITKSPYGYRYRAGQQNTHLVITRVTGGLRFQDTGTQKWKSFPNACHRQAASVGIAAVCSVPGIYGDGNHMLVEVWPRLGDDYVDGSSLPAMFDMTVLGDAGNDVAKTGAGNDFVNGAFGNDRASGGAGNDWIRTGLDNDKLWGGDGNDMLVGFDGKDLVSGGNGNDLVYGGSGSDSLWAGAGTDVASCGGGSDDAHVDSYDVIRECEVVNK